MKDPFSLPSRGFDLMVGRVAAWSMRYLRFLFWKKGSGSAVWLSVMYRISENSIGLWEPTIHSTALSPSIQQRLATLKSSKDDFRLSSCLRFSFSSFSCRFSRVIRWISKSGITARKRENIEGSLRSLMSASSMVTKEATSDPGSGKVVGSCLFLRVFNSLSLFFSSMSLFVESFSRKESLLRKEDIKSSLCVRRTRLSPGRCGTSSLRAQRLLNLRYSKVLRNVYHSCRFE